MQAPVAGSHMSAVHESPSSQRGALIVQPPAPSQESFFVHLLPSLQTAPAGCGDHATVETVSVQT